MSVSVAPGETVFTVDSPGSQLMSSDNGELLDRSLARRVQADTRFMEHGIDRGDVDDATVIPDPSSSLAQRDERTPQVRRHHVTLTSRVPTCSTTASRTRREPHPSDRLGLSVGGCRLRNNRNPHLPMPDRTRASTKACRLPPTAGSGSLSVQSEPGPRVRRGERSCDPRNSPMGETGQAPRWAEVRS